MLRTPPTYQHTDFSDRTRLTNFHLYLHADALYSPIFEGNNNGN